MIIPRWRSRRPQPPSPHKEQQLDSYPGTKIALGELSSPLKKFQKHCGAKHLGMVTQKG